MKAKRLGILAPAPLLAVVGVAVASFTVLGTPSTLAVPILGFLGIVATFLLARMQDPEEDLRFLLNLMLLGVAARFLVFTLIHETVGPYLFAPDQLTYESWGRSLLNHWTEGTPLPRQLRDTFQIGYPAINASLFAVFGEANVAPAVLNVFFSVWTAIPIYNVVRILLPDEPRVARISAGFSVLFPSLILWSTLNIREGPTILAVVSAVYFLVRMQRKTELAALVGAFVSLAILTLFREYLTSLVGIAGAAGVLMGRSRSPVRSLAAGSVMLVAVAIAFQSLGLGGSLTGEPTLERAQALRESFQMGAGSAYGAGADVSTTAGAITYLPVGLAYFLLAPFPWDIGSVLQAITLPETMLWWAIFPFGVWGALLVLRRQVRAFTVPLSVLLMVTMAYAMVESNVGTAYRHRGQVLPLMFIFCSIGIWHLLTRLRARREAERERRRRARESLRSAMHPSQRVS